MLNKKLELTIPTGWNTLTSKQLLAVSQLMIEEQTPAELQSKALLAFCGIHVLKVWGGEPILNENNTFSVINRDILIRQKGRLYHLKDWQILAAERMLDWLQTNPLFIRPLPKLKKYFPVNAIMAGTTFKQYLAAENNYQAFLFTKKTAFLDKLMSVLYPPTGGFDDSQTANHARRFRRCSAAEKNSVLLWYASIKNLFSDRFKYLFVIPAPASEEPAPPNMRETIDNMLYTLSEGDITKHPAIYEAETWAALSVLDKKALEYKKLTEKTK